MNEQRDLEGRGVEASPVQRWPGATGRVLGAAVALLVVVAGMLAWQAGEERKAEARSWKLEEEKRLEEGRRVTAGRAAYREAIHRLGKGEKMAAWTASGAGDSSYNGTYVADGDAFVNASGRWLYYVAAYWAMAPTKGVSKPEEAYYNGGDLPGTWVVGCGTAPAPTLAAGPWCQIGADAADAAKWDIAANHRCSLYGDVGGYKNVDSGVSGAMPTTLACQYGDLTVGTEYVAYLKYTGNTWDTFTFIAAAGTQNLVLDFGLPWAKDWDGDALWLAFLGAAGAKTLTLEIRKASDGTLICSDTAAWTMFIPATTISSPAAAATVGDLFNLVTSFTEWYYPATTGMALYYVYDTPETEVHIGDAWDATGSGSTTHAVDLAPAAPELGDLLLRVQQGTRLAADLTVFGPLIAADRTVTYSPGYSVEMTAPGSGAALLSGSNTAAAYVSGSVTGIDYVRLYALRLGVWTQVWQSSYSGRNVSMSPWLEVGDAGLKVALIHLHGVDEVELASDTVTITVTASGGVPIWDPLPPDLTEPAVYIVLPPAGATVDRLFTVHLTYGGYTAGTGHLHIIAVGSSTVTLHDGDEIIAASGVLAIACDLAAPAADGTYTLFVQLQNVAESEAATDSSTVALVAGGGGAGAPPTVDIELPLDGASVSGQVSVVVNATDDDSVYAVQLRVDGQVYGSLFAPNYSTTKYQFTWDSSTFANGSHELTAVAWDCDLQSATHTHTVNLVNAQADQEKVLFTKQLGRDSGGAPLNTESGNFRNRNFGRGIEIPEFPAAADLPADPRLRYNVFVGYHVPGDSVDFGDYTLVTPATSHLIAPAGKSIRWALKAVPQRTLAYWTLASQHGIRLAADTNRNVYVLCTTPYQVLKYGATTEEVTVFQDLSSLPSAPVDMVYCDGKVVVAYADRLLVLDPDTGDLDSEILLPWPDEVTAITALATDGTKVYVGATLAAGGSRLYEYTYGSHKALADHDHNLTALAYLGGVLYAGNDDGDILIYGNNAFTLAYATGEARVWCFTKNGSTIYAGTGTGGKVFKYVTGWGLAADFGWTVARALQPFDGYCYAGGVGTGGEYLYYEQTATGWAQTLDLGSVVGVNDLLTVIESDGHEQLFVATSGTGATCLLYRVEIAPASDFVCDPQPPDFHCKVLAD